MKKLSSIILWLVFYYATTPAACSNNETDLQALLAFKRAIDYDLSSWNETVHFCYWEGVLCSQRHQSRVVSINMMSQGLTGSLSPHLGNLSFLRTIILQNNSFYGQIPEELGRLRRLQLIEFSNNSFSGEIPKNLSHCTNLYYLNLIDNDLTGIVIPELASLLKLEALGLTRNQLSGNIPPFIGNFTSLVQLSLANCRLHGEIPESLVRLQTLQLLNLVGNNLSGRIPIGLYNISTMSIIQLRTNQLQGTIPSEMGFTFSRLRTFDLGENQLHGAFPISLSNCSLLEIINLSLNNFTGQMTADFTRLSALKSLTISATFLEGDISFISSMTNCTRLKVLYLRDNLFSGSLPDSISNLSSHLSYLNVAHNHLHGNIPSAIGNLIGLTRLSAVYSGLEGPVPSTIGKLDKLQEIYLGGNKLTNEIPISLGNLSLLNHLYLGQNNFYGNIPQSLGNCSKLLTLDISRNNLNGSIPRGIMSLSSISVSFNLAYNDLTGSIPSEVGSLRNLAKLDLSHNRLSGLIPNSLSSCISMELLHLESNSLNGEIPDMLSALRGLQNLDLSQNKLSGHIPRFLWELDLVYLNLSFNKLQGEVPTQGVFQNGSAISLEGNSDLCGGLAFLNLPPCPPKKKHFPLVWKILIPVLGAAAICITLSACYYIFIYRKTNSKKNQSSMPSLESKFLRLSYADLLKATGGFSEASVLGAGSFGSVYKGILDDGQTFVAVKVLNLNTKGASKSFISECNALKGIRHRNLVRLVSVCSSTDFQGNDFKALVYEFVANGSLDEWLHKKSEEERRNLSMKERLNIAIDIASALEYLHCGTDSTIVHGDLKPSNILLDEKMTAQVGDFGLAKVISNTFSTRESSSSIAIKGTIGYIPPEYGMSGKVSAEGDVYSYGILLLEMFTGRRPTDGAFNDHSTTLVDIVTSALPSQVMEIVDPIILHENKNKDCVVSILEIGLACSKELPKDRMSMTDVVKELCKTKCLYCMVE
ncbi:hypothetical protein RD792_005760 [Penstemon davidsonii]|uniref:Protein kinase domain-containing protein n=1 Tax=Penstemon davidsonii TaxID=160366 RepID=A0ABR0DEI4_9LAMI|nr:hypothetical protein RD792_005760 [Penstemon davidsonii]